MPVELLAEYNTAVAEVQITALRVLQRLLETEAEPKELRRLTAIAFRARTLTDPSAPPSTPRTRQARDPRRSANRDHEADRAPNPIASTHPIETFAEAAAAIAPPPHRSATAEPPTTDPIIIPPPLRSRRPSTSPLSPTNLMQAAASSTPLHSLARAG